jgi:hypothetical protein
MTAGISQMTTDFSQMLLYVINLDIEINKIIDAESRLSITELAFYR